MLNIGFVSLRAQFGFNPEEAGRLYEVSKSILAPLGRVTSYESMIMLKKEAKEANELLKTSQIDLLVMQIGTFPSGELLPLLIKDLAAPVLLWALPEPPFDGGALQFNSLCGVHLMASLLKRDNHKFDYVHLNPEGDVTSLTRYIRAFEVSCDLKKMRVGLVGSHTPGFDAMAVDAVSLKAVIGPEVVYIGLDDVFQGSNNVPQAQRDKLTAEIGSQFDNVNELPGEKIEKFANTYASLEREAKAKNVASLSVRCWPEFIEGHGQAACCSVSKLTDDGIVTGCEGDVLGTITSSIMREFAGSAPFLADIVHADYTTNETTLWHCGAAPFSLVAPGESVLLGEEFGIGGLNVEFPLKSGVVTLARLGYLDGKYRMLVTTGEALKIGPIVKGTVAQVRTDSSVKTLMDKLIYDGWEHHLTMIYTDVAAELEQLCKILNIECVRL
ncbi:hypothetical protein [Paenibacillus nasutitermitis]|uniref:Fucose isomerase n=1 Tax=Paenibacillus nasutitermitis TaxID=1652958 RepID=A0A916Z7A6_9BACL|nr:hypothetical protein [Paenibacillus nasutitermitis]GGD77884.1 fucose isomerase [Paenibacillus nasutitermitis]